MGYNTRRKSLSLPSLGIHLPNGGRSPSVSKASSDDPDAAVVAAAAGAGAGAGAGALAGALAGATGSSSVVPAASAAAQQQQQQQQPPPAKRRKRSHDSDTTSPALPDPYRTAGPPAAAAGGGGDAGDAGPVKARNISSLLERTPPPSPSPADHPTATATATTATVTTAPPAAGTKVDTEGISDDIVVAVIQQLEKTGNRPHLIKELATVLASTNESIANSANAAALISSRLSIYLKRPWTALAPCPIVKELIPVHPRKVFFYLANSPHQPLPRDGHQHEGDVAPTAPPVGPKQLTPSVSAASNAPDDEDEDELGADLGDVDARRARLSPSPEVDLSNPALDDETPSDDLVGHSAGGSFATRGLHLPRTHRLSHNHRAVSPPLEGDEREFTQTASSVRERASAEDVSGKAVKRSQDDIADGGDEKMHTGGDLDASASRQNADEYAQSHTQDRDYDDYFTSNLVRHFHQDQTDHHQKRQQQGQQEQRLGLGTVTESDLFAQSRSPSASSELSSVSSSTSVTSHGDVDHSAFETTKHPEGSSNENDSAYNYASAVLKGPADVTVGPGPVISASKVTQMQLKADGADDPVELLESKLQVDAAAFVDNDSTPDHLMATSPENAEDETEDIEMVDPMSMVKPVVASSSLGGMLDYALESWSDLQSPETMDIHELDAIFADI